MLIVCFILVLELDYTNGSLCPKYVQDSLTDKLSSKPSHEELLDQIANNNEDLFVELAKINNIELVTSIDESKAFKSSNKVNSVKFISYGDNPYIQENIAKEDMSDLLLQ